MIKSGNQPAGEWEQLGEPLAEAALLGCVLRGSLTQARTLLEQLDDSDWVVPEHAHVAAAARVLLEHGQPVDPVTVLGQLRRSGLENAQTASRATAVLLVELCAAAPAISSADHYARIVREHAYRRRAQQAATRLLQAADSGSLDALAALIRDEYEALVQHHQRISGTQPPQQHPARTPTQT